VPDPRKMRVQDEEELAGSIDHATRATEVAQERGLPGGLADHSADDGAVNGAAPSAPLQGRPRTALSANQVGCAASRAESLARGVAAKGSGVRTTLGGQSAMNRPAASKPISVSSGQPAGRPSR
jgi:hypothetical protein